MGLSLRSPMHPACHTEPPEVFEVRPEVLMTLTILDARTGKRVTIAFTDIPAVKYAAPAQVVSHPRFEARRQS
jgi:hypothetical protein